MTEPDARDRLIVGRDDIAVRDDSGLWWRICDEPATAVRQLVAEVTRQRDEIREDYREAERVGNAELDRLRAELAEGRASFARLQILCLGINFLTPARSEEVMRILKEGIGRD